MRGGKGKNLRRGRRVMKAEVWRKFERCSVDVLPSSLESHQMV